MEERRHSGGHPAPAHAAAALLAALLAGGCGDDGLAPEPHVYAAGWEWVASPDPEVLNAAAWVWVDGKVQRLTDGTTPAIATGLAVAGADVYVSGFVVGELGWTAVYWENGQVVPLTDGTSVAVAEDVAVEAGEVYAVGSERGEDGYTRARMWLNGRTYLLEVTGPSSADDVTIAGGDVYVAGHEYVPSQTEPGTLIAVARLWKNGVATALSDGALPAKALAVAVEGADVYVAGWAERGREAQAIVWKNGVATALTDGVYDALATGVAVDGGRVLASGAAYDGISDVARVWLGGAPMDLTSPTARGEVSPGFANAVATSDGDVYVAGRRGADAVYWKNGTEVRLTHGGYDADALAIVVVR